MTTPLSQHEQKILAELELQFPEVDTPAVSPSAVEAPEQESPRYWSRRHVVASALARKGTGSFGTNRSDETSVIFF